VRVGDGGLLEVFVDGLAALEVLAFQLDHDLRAVPLGEEGVVFGVSSSLTISARFFWRCPSCQRISWPGFFLVEAW
jgi:hypothetical protein